MILQEFSVVKLPTCSLKPGTVVEGQQTDSGTIAKIHVLALLIKQLLTFKPPI